jgi:micrococcal nuclease
MAIAAWAATALLGACGGAECGPEGGEVARIIDGDTIVLRSGETVRYLLIDAPETAHPPHCYGMEALEANRALVDGRTIRLRYDVQCEDPYGRLLAYVTVADREVNQTLVERGFACVLHIPPNGADVWQHFEELQAAAKQFHRGLWGACAQAPPC